MRRILVKYHLVTCLCLPLLLFLTSGTIEQAGSNLNRYELTQSHMGTVCRLVIYADSKEGAERAGAAAFERIQQLDQIMSDYRDSSELMRLCVQPPGQDHPVSPDLLTVLRVAQEVAAASGGAFDVTCGPLSQLWRRARRQKQLPSEAAIAEAMGRVGYGRLILNSEAGTVRLMQPGMRLDLGGIAKGYAADQALQALVKAGCSRAMVVLGGEVAVGAPPPGQPGWKVAIANRSEAAPLLLSHAAVSTSGDAEQYLELNGRRFSHIIDPRTGWALTASPQVTVITQLGLWADPLATAASVLSSDEAEQLLNRFPPSAGLFRHPLLQGWKERTTLRWAEWVKN
jgi:thiamine biosynthesis lipoprotein